MKVKRQGSSARFPRVYSLLKRAGFSAGKAIEIIIDARRGDPHALLFVKLTASNRKHHRA